jgi:polysaccharide deacetylase 2 family uncharacterized protein YibQ/cell division protein FtsB
MTKTKKNLPVKHPKKTTRRKKRLKKGINLNKVLRIVLFSLIAIFIIGSVGIITYYASYDPDQEEKAKQITKGFAEHPDFNYTFDDEKKLLKDIKDLMDDEAHKKQGDQKTLEKEKKQVEKKREPLLQVKKPKKEVVVAPIVKSFEKEKLVVEKNHKPKLAIIFDDVSFSSQIKAIHKLSFPSTPSFFPATFNHPKTAKFAQKEAIYMIHLPLEAMYYDGEEPHTLHIGDSKEKMVKRLLEIKKEFPRLKYLNNHTGSKFTSDLKSMDKLMQACLENDLVFVDSRTTSQTKVPILAKKYKIPYIARNVFLDHEADVSYIKNQLKKAVYYAKKNGQAIAIGHPRTTTLQALSNVDDILRDVECVTIDKLKY